MATMKLTPSTYYLSNSSYLSVSNANNMYTDTDSTTYATVTNSRTSTSSYYIYIRGFNFDDIPSNAVVSDFTIRLKGNYSGGYSQKMYLYDGTSTSMGRASSLSSTVYTREFTCDYSWDNVVAAGSDFSIRINCRRSSRNTTSYIYIYGAEIEVTYTIPDPRTITINSTGDGTVTPSGTNTYYDNDEIEIVISPTNKSDTVTITRDGSDITSQLVAHGAGSTSSFTAASYETSDIQSGSSYASYCIGHTAESPSSSGTSSNMYASDEGYADYTFDFSSIPSTAIIEEVNVRVYGHRESSTIDSSHISNVALYSGSTKKGTDIEFPYTSNSLETFEDTGTWTRAELDNAVLRHTVGYYGGLVLGITFEVTYSTDSGLDHYTYTFTVSGDTSISIVIGGSESGPKIFIKQNGSWIQCSKVYLKVNGAWVEQGQSTWTSLFNTSTNYRLKE